MYPFQRKAPSPPRGLFCCVSTHTAGLSSLSTPRPTTFNASSGKGRYNAFASSHGARIQTSRSSSVVRITGIALGWIGSTTAFGVVVRKPIDVARTSHRLRLRAAVAFEDGPDAGKGEQRPVLVECEPYHVLFACLGIRPQARIPRSRPEHRLSGFSQAAPVRRGSVADVGDWRNGEFRWRRHAPAHHRQLTLGACVAHYRRGIVGKHACHWRQVADVLVDHAKQAADVRMKKRR